MPTRIYVVTDSSTKAERLVRATFRATAVRHVAQSHFAARAATQDDLERLITAGVRVEQAVEPAPEPVDADAHQSHQLP